VVGHRQREVGPAHAATREPQRLEGLRTGDFVNQMPVDIEQAGAVLASLDDMRVPDLLVQCARFARHGGDICGKRATGAIFPRPSNSRVMEKKGINP
jgi:hypothetical protein